MNYQLGIYQQQGSSISQQVFVGDGFIVFANPGIDSSYVIVDYLTKTASCGTLIPEGIIYRLEGRKEILCEDPVEGGAQLVGFSRGKDNKVFIGIRNLEPLTSGFNTIFHLEASSKPGTKKLTKFRVTFEN